MAKKVLRIFFSSPSDCEDLFETAKNSVADYNQTNITDESKPSFQIFNYKVFPSCIGETAQDFINKKLFPEGEPTKFECYLGILRHHFGQPTKKYNSGTEEEFSKAIERQKEGDKNLKSVAFLFSAEPLEDTSNKSLEQKQKVNEFRDKISSVGLYKTFKDLDAFWREINLCLEDWAKLKEESVAYEIESRDLFNNLKISEDFRKELNALDALIWSQNSNVKDLEDVWVEPRITIDSFFEGDRARKKIAHKDISFEEVKEALIAGDSIDLRGAKNTGKTVFGRKLFLDLWKNEKGYIPVLIKGDQIRHSDKKDIFKRLKSLVTRQYKNFSLVEAEKIENNKLIVIVDDLFHSQIREEYSSELKEELHQKVHACLFLGADTDVFEFKNQEEFKEITEKKKIRTGQIHTPKSEKTDAMIRRWCDLKKDSVSTENDIVKIYKQLNHVFQTGFLERNFFHILLLLRTLESDSVDKTEKGDLFYYKLLILNNLKTKLKKEDIEQAEELLSRLAWECLIASQLEVSEENFNKMLTNWAEENGLSNFSLQKVMQDLISCNILAKEENGIKFSQAYVASYYEAQIFYTKLSKKDSKAEAILEKFHHEVWTRKSALTLEFFASLDHGNRAFEIVINKIKKSYEKNQDLLQIDDNRLKQIAGDKSLVKNLRIDSSHSSKENRIKHLKKRDKSEIEQNFPQKIHEHLSDFEQLFSSLRVAGNLLRENYSSLKKEDKERIFRESTLAMRRLLGMLCTELLEQYKRFIEGKSEEEVEEAHTFAGFFTIIRLLVTMLKFAEALGDKCVDYSLYYGSDEEPLHKLYLLSCNLESHEKIDFKNLADFMTVIKNKPLFSLAMREFVRYRLESWRPGRSETQKLCNIVNIPYTEPAKIALKAKA